MSVNVAIIGAGQNSQRNHFPMLKGLEKEGYCRLVAVYDINLEVAKKASESFGFEEYVRDAESIFTRKDIDAVYIFGTVQMHYEYMQRALENGKHVFVEKPPTPDLASAIAMAKLAREKGKVVAVGFNRRFYDSTTHARSITDGRTKIYSLEAVYHKPFLDETYMHGSSSWIQYSAIHGIDAACYLLGHAGLPKALYSAWNIASGDSPQNLSALLVWENGSHAVVSSNQSAGSRAEEYTLHAEDVTYSCTESEFTAQRRDGRKEIIPYKNQHQARGFYGEHKEFFEAIAGEKEARHSILNSLPIMHLVELMEQGYCGNIDWEKIRSQAVVSASETLSAGRSEPSPVSITLTKGEKHTVLVLNPTTLKLLLPDISREHTIIYQDDLTTLPPEQLAHVRAIITGQGGGSVTTEMLDLLPSLAIVGIIGASVRKYNPEEILKRHIVIANASDIYAEAVAEFTLMQALVGIKNASLSHDTMRKGGWGIQKEKVMKKLITQARTVGLKNSIAVLRPLLRPIWKSFKDVLPKEATQPAAVKIAGGRNLRGLRVGIIGYGAIAREFIKLLVPFECEIRVYSEYLSDAKAAELGVTKGTLAQVLNADIVSLHRGLSERTRHSFGKEEIALMKSGTIFLNTARGAIVDEAALIERLKKGDIIACLDVFEEEPLAVKSPLRALPNVFLTSHIGGVTKETFTHSPDAVVQKVLAYLNGEPVEYLITSEDMLQNMT